MEIETHIECGDSAMPMVGRSDAVSVAAQTTWAATPLSSRLLILQNARHKMAAQSSAFADAISSDLARNRADTLVAEVLPLLAACRFIEREAKQILAVRRLGRRGLPFWLAGVDSEIHRVPFGTILVIGPANYPLFLPAVQALQALAAGNSVVWKPGRGGAAVATLFAKAMQAAGLPDGLLRVTADTIEAATQEIERRPAKVFFTGSAFAGQAVMRRLAETATPCVMELSGCDAVVVLPSADLTRVVKALTFGMRLNGSATCMAPRRVLLVDASPERLALLVRLLTGAFEEVPGVTLSRQTVQQLSALVASAAMMGATIHGSLSSHQRPILVINAGPEMEIARTDVFAPVLSLISVRGTGGVVEAQAACPFGLTAAVFGEEHQARALGAKLEVGTVLINDLIISTADPRVPFGARRASGFGATRGAEGLLEMTAVKVVSARRGKQARQYEATSQEHERLFAGLIEAFHAGTWKVRWQGMKKMADAGRELGKRK